MAISNQFFFSKFNNFGNFVSQKSIVWVTLGFSFNVAKWQKFAKIKTLLGSLEYNMEI
jgi:hypothetical protein